MKALILAGGSGTRFWPLSTKSTPKQFLKLFNNKSMLQLTYERLLPSFNSENIFIVTIKDQIPLIKNHITDIKNENIIIEPFGMNTAPCIALSIIYLNNIFNSEERILILPADHFISDINLFNSVIQTGMNEVKNDILLTYGITPTFPATGYGYIESEKKYNNEMFHVKHFKEKPNLELATEFLQKGNFYWNSGMFSWNLKTIIDAFKKYEPETLTITENVINNQDNDLYATIPKKPIDIAIMEQADNVVVMPVNFAWSDVGNWHSLSELMPKDENENYFKSPNYNSASVNNSVFSDKPVALIGVENLVVVETEDALLIVRKDLAESVKDVKIK